MIYIYIFVGDGAVSQHDSHKQQLNFALEKVHSSVLCVGLDALALCAKSSACYSKSLALSFVDACQFELRLSVFEVEG